jgi:hypothetical protein
LFITANTECLKLILFCRHYNSKSWSKWSLNGWLVSWQEDDSFKFLRLETAAVHRNFLFELVDVPTLWRLSPRTFLVISTGQLTRFLFLWKKWFSYFRFLQFFSIFQNGSGCERSSVNVFSVRQIIVVINDVRGGRVSAEVGRKSILGRSLFAVRGSVDIARGFVVVKSVRSFAGFVTIVMNSPKTLLRSE